MLKKKRYVSVSSALLIFGALMLHFTACKEEDPPKTQIIDLGDVPEVYLATVPYQDGDVVKMMHESSRLVINYHVSRMRFSPLDSSSEWPSSSIIYDYKVDYTELKPDYPTFEIGIALTSGYRRYELEGVDAPKRGYTWLGNSDAYVPFIHTDATGYTMLDSLEVNGHVYYDVFKLDCDPDSIVTENDIYSVICYYNYAKGFIGIEMSNNEKYWLYEE